MHTFPDLIELWEEILEHLSQHDLQHLALTSRQLLHIVRRILYRSVRFFDYSNGRFTHNLLVENQTVAERVLELEVWPHSAFDWTTAMHLKNLRTLVMVYNPFGPKQEETFKALSHSSPKLKVLKVRQPPSYWSQDEWELCFFALKGIEKLIWEETGRKHTSVPQQCTYTAAEASLSTLPAVINAFQSYASTLTHIYFSFMILYREGPQIEGHSARYAGSYFLRERFPRLKYLDVALYERSPEAHNSAAALASFLLAHPLLEHLSLRPDGDDENLGLNVCPNTLPNLRYFFGTVFHFATLVKGAQFSQTLTVLHLKEAFAKWSDNDDLLHSLEVFGGLPSLKEFRFEVETSDTSEAELVYKFILSLGPQFPALECLAIEMVSSLSSRL